MDSLQPFCLAGLLLLSLVLPLKAASQKSESQTNSLLKHKMVWAGQLTGAFCGLLIMASPIHPVCSLTFAVISTVFFSKRLEHLQRIA